MERYTQIPLSNLQHAKFSHILEETAMQILSKDTDHHCLHQTLHPRDWLRHHATETDDSHFQMIPIQPFWYSQASLRNLESANFSRKLEEIALTASNFTPQGLDEAPCYRNRWKPFAYLLIYKLSWCTYFSVLLYSDSVKFDILDTFIDRCLVILNCSWALKWSL